MFLVTVKTSRYEAAQVYTDRDDALYAARYWVGNGELKTEEYDRKDGSFMVRRHSDFGTRTAIVTALINGTFAKVE